MTSQTDLDRPPIPRPTIPALHELCPPSESTTNRCKETRHTQRLKSPSPYSKPQKTRSSSPRRPTERPKERPKDVAYHAFGGEDLSELSEESSTDSVSESKTESKPPVQDTAIIPKPDGEAGRPRRGGYNLQDAVNWQPQKFRHLQNTVHRLIDNHLDITKSIRQQNLRLIEIVRSSATAAIPELSCYEGCWPVQDLIALRLKNTARREKVRAEKLAKLQAAAADVP